MIFQPEFRRLQSLPLTISTDFSRQGNFVIFPIYSDLSDHDAQLITIHDTGLYDQIHNIINIRRINENSLNDFKYILNFELWEGIFAKKEVNTAYNSFLNTFVRNFHSNFPLMRKIKNNKTCIYRLRTIMILKL